MKRTNELNEFSKLTKRLLSVSKKEIDKRHEEWDKQKDKKRKPKSPADAAFSAVLAMVLKRTP